MGIAIRCALIKMIAYAMSFEIRDILDFFIVKAIAIRSLFMELSVVIN
jgi:hypothetical protein